MQNRRVDLTYLVDCEFGVGAGGGGGRQGYAACVGGLAAALGVEDRGGGGEDEGWFVLGGFEEGVEGGGEGGEGRDGGEG